MLLALSGQAAAEVRLPAVFSDHMVLQRDKPVKVWGWAEPGEKIRVSLSGRTADAVASPAGGWSLELPAMAAGGPHKMTVAAKNTLKVRDILVGEVWLASGQSNMEFELKHAGNAGHEIKSANYPQIRLLLVPRTAEGLPRDDLNARWSVCAPDNPAVADFSAVAYFFGREIHRAIGVPVG